MGRANRWKYPTIASSEPAKRPPARSSLPRNRVPPFLLGSAAFVEVFEGKGLKKGESIMGDPQQFGQWRDTTGDSQIKSNHCPPGSFAQQRADDHIELFVCFVLGTHVLVRNRVVLFRR